MSYSGCQLMSRGLVPLLLLTLTVSRVFSGVTGISPSSNIINSTGTGENLSSTDNHATGGNLQTDDNPPTCEEKMMMNLENCREVEEKECGLCHDVFVKDCGIHIDISFVPVKIRECRTMPGCVLGAKFCKTKYRKECTQELQYLEQPEEFPMCGVEMVRQCDEPSLNSLLEEEELEEECRDVPVMKCHMEKKMLKKESTVTVCRSVPEELCDPSDCKKCHDKVSMKRELVPKQKCSYKEKRICQESTECRTRTKVECEPSSLLMIQKLCSEPYSWRLAQIP